MKKGNLPKQEYKLINVCMQTIENGVPYTCDDCGRTIFNIATIKGKSDNKTYNVGLSCVKKLLNKSIYFDLNDMFEYERQESEYRKAINTLKWLKEKEEKDIYDFSLWKNDECFCFQLHFKKDFGGYKKGYYGGSTSFLELNTMNLFVKYIK